MQTDVILVVGKRGTGKTTWAKEFIKDKTRVIVAEARFDEFGIKTAANLDEFREILKTGFFRVSYSPRSWEWAEFLDLVIVSGKVHGPLWLILEEASRIPRTLEQYEEINILGRHYGINLVAMSTRAHHLPPDYRSQITRLVAFRQHDPKDLDYLRDIIGDRVDALPRLSGHKHIEWNERDTWQDTDEDITPEPAPNEKEENDEIVHSNEGREDL